jgi:arylsulfatase A-like enzyme
VRRDAARPFFFYLHYLDPHAPYRPADPFREKLAGERCERPLDLYQEIEPRLPQLRASGFGPGDPRYEDLVTRYDAEIAATDAALEQLFRGLEALAVLDRTLVVITADHGEEFLEHGWVEHGWALYQESIHVPLLFWAPAALQPARSGLPASHVDVLPTLVQLLGLEAPRAGLDGVPLFEGSPAAPRASQEASPRFVELLIPRRNVSRAVMVDGWKYVASHRWVEPEKRAASRAPASSIDLTQAPVREALYHFASDAGETRDLASEEPERLAALRSLLRVRAPSAAPVAPAPSAPIDAEEAARLRALGYAE